MERSPNNSQSDFDLSTLSVPWQDAVRSVFRHRKLVLITVAFGLLAAIVRAATLPPTYRAYAVLMVKDSRARMAVSPDAETRSVLDRGEAQVNALAALVRDSNLIRDAILRGREKASGEDAAPADAPAQQTTKTEQPAMNPLQLPARLYRKVHDIPAPDELDQRARALANQIQVSPVWRTSLIQLSFVSGDPQWAATFVNNVSQTLIEKYQRIYESSSAQEFFRGQREVLETKLDEATVARRTFREQVGTDLLTLNPEELRQRITVLSQALDSAKTQRAEIASRASTEQIDVGSNPALNSLRQRILELKMQRSELLSRYTATSIAVRDLDRQIAEAKRLVDREIATTIDMQRGAAQFTLDGIDARIATITAQMDQQRETLRQVESVAPEWERLETAVARAREAYQTYARKEEQARFSNALDESDIVNVAIVEPAKPPTKPESSRIKRILAMGLMGSLMLGVGLALLRDWLDPSAKTTMQVERLTGLPVLGEIQT